MVTAIAITVYPVSIWNGRVRHRGCNCRRLIRPRKGGVKEITWRPWPRHLESTHLMASAVQDLVGKRLNHHA